MGVCLYISVDHGLRCPFWFTKSDSKALVSYIAELESRAGAVPNSLGKLVEHFDLDIQPLLKIAGQEFTIEELGISEAEFQEYQESNQAAWQSPQELIDCLQAFIQKIDDEPEVFSRLQITDDYFLRGFFIQDLLDLIHMAEWAKDNGAAKLKLEAA